MVSAPFPHYIKIDLNFQEKLIPFGINLVSLSQKFTAIYSNLIYHSEVLEKYNQTNKKA